MFGLGVPEMGIIGVAAFLVFVPYLIPVLGVAPGKTLRVFKEDMDKPSVDDEYFEDEEEQ